MMTIVQVYVHIVLVLSISGIFKPTIYKVGKYKHDLSVGFHKYSIQTKII